MKLVAAASAVALVACSADEGALPSAPDAAPDAEHADAEARDAATRDASQAPDAAPDAGPPVVPDIDAIAWNAGPSVGYGVAAKDSGNPAGESMFVAYAGYNVALDGAKAWATALYKAWLQPMGVRYIWAVQGPAQSNYASLEIGNSKIAQAMLPLVSPKTKTVLIAGHSSGSFVAHELLNQLATGADPLSLTKGRVVYFNLDGGSQGGAPSTGLSAGTVSRLRKAYFVAPYASGTGTYGLNLSDMQSLGNTYGGFFQVDSNAAGCQSGAKLCLHISLVITKPHNPAGADPVLDYQDFAGRPVTTAYLSTKAAEAGLGP